MFFLLLLCCLLQIRRNDVVYDLGCGDGRLLVEAVKSSGARGVRIMGLARVAAR